MGLIKSVIGPDRIPVEYHRVVSISNSIHSHFTIAVLSYFNKEERTKQKEDPTYVPYTTSTSYIKRYDDPTADEDLSIRQAYEHLKILETFEGATDDYDDD